jgi:hypothetical protein
VAPYSKLPLLPQVMLSLMLPSMLPMMLQLLLHGAQ